MPDIYSAKKDQKSLVQKSAPTPRATDALHFASESEKQKDKHHTKNPWAAYAVIPDRIKIDIQDPQEKILFLARKHLITNLRWIFVSLLLLLLPIAFGYLDFSLILPPSFGLVLALFWYLFVFGYAFQQLLSWYFNVYIVTDERIIDVDFYNLLYKSIASAKISQIEDVTATTGGALRNIFDFGSVTIQTAGERREFEFTDIPHPSRVVKFLNLMSIEEEQEEHEGRVR